jgi:hypothetical protein
MDFQILFIRRHFFNFNIIIDQRSEIEVYPLGADSGPHSPNPGAKGGDWYFWN